MQRQRRHRESRQSILHGKHREISIGRSREKRSHRRAEIILVHRTETGKKIQPVVKRMPHTSLYQTECLIFSGIKVGISLHITSNRSTGTIRRYGGNFKPAVIPQLHIGADFQQISPTGRPSGHIPLPLGMQRCTPFKFKIATFHRRTHIQREHRNNSAFRQARSK